MRALRSSPAISWCHRTRSKTGKPPLLLIVADEFRRICGLPATRISRSTGACLALTLRNTMTTTFADFGLSEALLNVIAKIGYTTSTPIQA